MREFFLESLLPFASVCVVITGLTLAIFDVPSVPPPARSAGPPASQVVLTPALIPDTTSRPPARDLQQAQERMNDVLARAVRALSAAPAAAGSVRVGTAPAGAAPLGASETPPDPKLFGVVSKLSQATQIARDARDDRDLQRAEELMRSAREEMDSVCDKAGGAGPLCQSAAQIREMGF